MQAWDSVKVSNENSEHKGRAGNVIRVETQGETSLVFVELDAVAGDDGAETHPKEIVTFDASELTRL